MRGGKCDAGREVWKWGVVGMTQMSFPSFFPRRPIGVFRVGQTGAEDKGGRGGWKCDDGREVWT